MDRAAATVELLEVDLLEQADHTVVVAQDHSVDLVTAAAVVAVVAD